jgi:hypothetical protein
VRLGRRGPSTSGPERSWALAALPNLSRAGNDDGSEEAQARQAKCLSVRPPLWNDLESKANAVWQNTGRQAVLAPATPVSAVLVPRTHPLNCPTKVAGDLGSRLFVEKVIQVLIRHSGLLPISYSGFHFNRASLAGSFGAVKKYPLR